MNALSSTCGIKTYISTTVQASAAEHFLMTYDEVWATQSSLNASTL